MMSKLNTEKKGGMKAKKRGKKRKEKKERKWMLDANDMG